MARPIKLGLDYFPMDTTFFQNIRIRRLIKEHGFSGLALYLNLVCDIYANSYYLQIDSDYYFIMSDQIGKTEDELRKQIATMYKIGLFEKQFETEGVVTSKEIQENYIFCKGKRFKAKRLDLNYLIVDPSSVTGSFVGQNYISMGVLSGKSTHSKVKESKVKESKVDESKVLLEKNKFFSNTHTTRACSI